MERHLQDFLDLLEREVASDHAAGPEIAPLGPDSVDLFGNTAKQVYTLDVLPVSVVDVVPQRQLRRMKGGHDTTSSREEFSHFPLEVGDLALSLFLRDVVQVFDPFAGWGERHALARAYQKSYTGFDISETAIVKAGEVYGVRNHCVDSRTADIPIFDGLLTCPPYWNLEVYTAQGIENAPSFDLFCTDLRQIFQRCYDAAAPGARFCVLVGDWRAGHVYYDLCYRVAQMFDAFGAIPFDSVVISRRATTKIKLLIPQAVRLGYTVKVHEMLLVFDKSGL